MKNTMEVRGYTLHRHNDDLMVEDLELAKRLGYERLRDIRKLIKRMLESSQIAAETVCATAAQTSAQGGRPSATYWLSEKAALKVITKSETAMADAITDEIIDVYMAARRGETKPRHQDEVTVPFKRAETVARSTLRLCKMLGTETGMAKAIAVEEVRRATGLDISRMIAGNRVEEAPLTPTRLGEVAGISAADMNRVLLNNGMQVKDGTGRYEPTAKGRPFCTLNPYQSPYSEHTDYRPLWFRRVLDAVDLSRLDADAGRGGFTIPQRTEPPGSGLWDGFVPNQE